MAPPALGEIDVCQDSHMVPGNDVTWDVTGAIPGERVFFALSDRIDPLDARCVGPIDGCLDLGRPTRFLGSALADAEGVARLTVTIPADAPVGAHVEVQAVVMRGEDGAESLRTLPAGNDLVADFDGPGACHRADLCDYDLCACLAGGEGSCDAVCEPGEEGSPDCDGQCDLDEDTSSPDCNGRCEPGEPVGSGDCPEACITYEQISVDAGIAPERSSTGMFIDVDGDGDLDLYSRSQGLLINDGTGAFTDQTGPSGITLLPGDPSRSPLSAGDVDGDGDVDILACNDTRFGDVEAQLWINDGTGNFVDQAEDYGFHWLITLPDGSTSGTQPRACPWVDADGDGDLDMLLASEFNKHGLFRNDGAPPMVNTVADFAPAVTQGDSAAFYDFDRDADLDLFIPTGSFASQNRLFRNDGGTWLDVATEHGVNGGEGGMRWGGSTWSDLEGDGDMDLYVLVNALEDRLYVNDGSGHFEQQSPADWGLGDATDISGSATWVDYDRDGDLDVFIPENGLFQNDGGAYRSVTAEVGLGLVRGGAVFGDIDGDGLLDLFVPTRSILDTDQLYRATATGDCVDRSALRVEVLTDNDGDATDGDTSDDRAALGAELHVDLDGDGDFAAGPDDQLAIYLIGHAQSGHHTQSQFHPLVGIGTAESVDLRVYYPDWSVVEQHDVAGDIALRDSP
jgi:hypothetical protein